MHPPTHKHTCNPQSTQAFAEVLANNETWTAPMDETYELLGIEPESVNSLDTYLKVRARRGRLFCVLNAGAADV